MWRLESGSTATGRVPVILATSPQARPCVSGREKAVIIRDDFDTHPQELDA